jgi:hypothetical protein
MNKRMAVLALPLALGFSACRDNPAAPTPAAPTRMAPSAVAEAVRLPGTGIVIRSPIWVGVPLVGGIVNGTVNIDQAVITNISPVTNIAGQIVGLQVDGVLNLTAGVLGSDVLRVPFTTSLAVTPGGPGACSVVSIDLGQVSINALLGRIDIPALTVNGTGSGIVGTILCRLATLLGGLTGG